MKRFLGVQYMFRMPWLILYAVLLFFGICFWMLSDSTLPSNIPTIPASIKTTSSPPVVAIVQKTHSNYERCHEVNCVDCPSNFVPDDISSTYLLPNRFSKTQRKANAVITILCRDNDLEGVLKSLSSFEPSINSQFGYPYVFLNNEEFSQKFKSTIMSYISSFRKNPLVTFSQIPTEHWTYPPHINQTLAAEKRRETANLYIYGGLESYRFMIRYFSGPFFHHPDLLQYDYYWRVEPDVDFFCNLEYDPFLLMQDRKLKYGFNIMIPELMKTIPTLYDNVKQFRDSRGIIQSSLMSMFQTPGCGDGFVGTGRCFDGSCCSVHGWCGTSPDYCDKEKCARQCRYSEESGLSTQQEFAIAQTDLDSFERDSLGNCGDGYPGNGVCQDGGCCSKWGFCGSGMEYCNDLTCIGGCDSPGMEMYNGNHFWSNFEIADFKFFRGEQYTDYFNHLDHAGGFFYERWGDAPVHSLAVGLFLKPEQVHYFGDIGYRHAELTHCPQVADGCSLKCSCSHNGTWGSNSIEAWHRFGSKNKIF